MTRIFGLICLALLGVGCAAADFVGTYTVTVTNESNGCGFSPWSVGAATPGVTVVISQDGGQVSAQHVLRRGRQSLQALVQVGGRLVQEGRPGRAAGDQVKQRPRGRREDLSRVAGPPAGRTCWRLAPQLGEPEDRLRERRRGLA